MSQRKELGITQQSIADILNISQGAVGHYLNGRNALNLQTASVFATQLNVPISDFSPSLAAEAQALSAAIDSNISGLRPYKPSPRYPLISWVQAGAGMRRMKLTGWIKSTNGMNQKPMFRGRILAESRRRIHDRTNRQSVPDGSLILIDTGKDSENGSLVVAKLTDSNEATFKNW